MKILLTLLIVLSTFAHAKKVKVEEHEFFTKGFRVLINTLIEDKQGIYEARVYFKHSMVQDYQVYVPMVCLGNRCSAELPLTDNTLQKFDFIVVYQSSNGEVYKSYFYTMEKRDMLELPSWQTLNSKEIDLYTDYAKPMQSIRGFHDRFNVKKSSGDALGVEAGLYTLEMINPKAKIDCSLCVPQKDSEITFEIKDK